MSDMKFVEGLYFKEPTENTPDFIKGKLSIQKQKFVAWLENEQSNEKGYINLDIKISQGGKPYISVDNWEPNSDRSAPQQSPQYTPEQQAQLDKPIDPVLDDQVPF